MMQHWGKTIDNANAKANGNIKDTERDTLGVSFFSFLSIHRLYMKMENLLPFLK